MKKQLQAWKLISQSLLQNIPVMLMYVLQSAGSSPGRRGFFMAVNANGEMEGSIGGGIMEHKFVEMAKEKLKAAVHELSLRKQVHDKRVAKDQSGMICSGEQMILLYTIDESDQPYIDHIISSLEQNKTGLLSLSPGGLKFSNDVMPSENFVFSYISEENWLYEEKVGYKNNLHIVGGGHCSLALAKIMSMMDFYIHLYDDRPALNTFHQNDHVHEKTVVDDYNKLRDLIPSGDNEYVVVMTFGYRTDDIVIRALLNKQFKYIGVLGSMSKMNKMFSDYKIEGIGDEQLKKIYSPIGLPINSQTPEEIAISIAAEIIQVKNEAK